MVILLYFLHSNSRISTENIPDEKTCIKRKLTQKITGRDQVFLRIGLGFLNAGICAVLLNR